MQVNSHVHTKNKWFSPRVQKPSQFRPPTREPHPFNPYTETKSSSIPHTEIKSIWTTRTKPKSILMLILKQVVFGPPKIWRHVQGGRRDDTCDHRLSRSCKVKARIKRKRKKKWQVNSNHTPKNQINLIPRLRPSQVWSPPLRSSRFRSSLKPSQSQCEH